MPSLTVETSDLKKLEAKFSNPSIKETADQMLQQRALAALVAEAIADNFNKEGPGWAPLKPSTIRESVSKKLKKQLSGLSDQQIVVHEKKAKGTGKSFRKILQRTGLLFNCATVPNFSGSKNGVAGKNVYRVEKGKLIWGCDLAYAGIHNKGDSKRHIPQREFMVIRNEWKKKLVRYVYQQASQVIKDKIGGAL